MKTFLTKRKKYELSSYFFFHTHLTPPKMNCQTFFSGGDFSPGDFFPSDFFGGDSKGGSHPRTHHSNFNHIPLNDIHIAIRFHTIAYTTTTTHHTHAYTHIHLHAHIHTYAYTHTGQPGNVDKKTHQTHPEQKAKSERSKKCLLSCVHARICVAPLFLIKSVWFNRK